MARPWSYQEAHGKEKVYTERKYLAKLQALQRKTEWEDAELENLQTHLEPLSLPQRMEHLDLLHHLPRNYIDYQPTKSRHTKRSRSLHPRTLKTMSSLDPWRFEVTLFMGTSRRIPPNVPPEVLILRQINDGISALMLKEGWCQSTVQLIRHAFHVPGLHLAMLLCAPTTSNSTERDHSRCSRTQCQALQVNRYTHTASHVHLSCARQCYPIWAEEAEVDGIIQLSEGIPRVVVPLTGELPSKLDVVGQGNFVAISHVWSHGFGFAPGDNAMPACQVDRLRDYLRDLPGRQTQQLIWIDVFCVPESRPCKSKATSRIAQTFRQADKIVVLDAKLLETSCRVSPFIQCIRILSSDWMRRLWTLEEAMLGCANVRRDKLYFRFSDGYVTLQKLLQELRSKQCPYSHSAVMALERHLTLRLVPDWRIWVPRYDSTAARFAQLARALEYRNTSRRSDEMLCMASILGLSTKAILGAASSEDRAIAFYQTLQMVPVSILFCNGVRIFKKPFRWALASFIAAEDPRKLSTLSKMTNHFGRCGPDGLHVRAPGIFFEMERETVCDFNRLWIYTDRLSLEPLGWGYPCQVPPWQSWAEIRRACAEEQQLVLIINPSCDHEAVVLRPTNKVDHCYHVEFLCQVHIRYAGKRPSVDEEPIWRQESSQVQDNDGEDQSEDETLEAHYRGINIIPSKTPELDKRSISARCRHRTGELQKWIIT